MIMAKRKKASATAFGLTKTQRKAKKAAARKKTEENKTAASSASAVVPTADLPPADVRTADLRAKADLPPGDQDNSARSPSSPSDLSTPRVPSRRPPEIHIKDPSGGLKLASDLLAGLAPNTWWRSLEDPDYPDAGVDLASGTRQEWSAIMQQR